MGDVSFQHTQLIQLNNCAASFLNFARLVYDTVLLKQKKLPALYITCVFFECGKRNLLYPLLFFSVEMYLTKMMLHLYIEIFFKSCQNSFVCEQVYLIFLLQH